MSALEADLHRRLLEERVADHAVAGRLAQVERDAAALLPAAGGAEVAARA